MKALSSKQNARIGERNEGILDGSTIIADLRGIQSLRRKYPPNLVFGVYSADDVIGQESGIMQNKKTVPERLTSD